MYIYSLLLIDSIEILVDYLIKPNKSVIVLLANFENNLGIINNLDIGIDNY